MRRGAGREHGAETYSLTGDPHAPIDAPLTAGVTTNLWYLQVEGRENPSLPLARVQAVELRRDINALLDDTDGHVGHGGETGVRIVMVHEAVAAEFLGEAMTRARGYEMQYRLLHGNPDLQAVGSGEAVLAAVSAHNPHYAEYVAKRPTDGTPDKLFGLAGLLTAFERLKARGEIVEADWGSGGSEATKRLSVQKRLKGLRQAIVSLNYRVTERTALAYTA